MGAAWRKPKDRDLDSVCAMVEGVKALGMETCVTLGMLTGEQAKRLKASGLDYYNHNLDTSPEYLRRDHHHAHLSATVSTRSDMCATPAFMSAAAASSAWARAPRIASA